LICAETAGDSNKIVTADAQVNLRIQVHLPTELRFKSQEPYISAKEPYISAKEPYISAKEPYISA